MSRVPRPKAALAALAVSAAGGLTAACSMVGSTPIDLRQPLGCASTSGSYYLSKTNIEVVVNRYRQTTKVRGRDHVTYFHKLESVTPKRKPDHSHGYCLDYIASPTTDEKVWVKKNQDFLLEQISTQAIDQSAYALITLINAAGTLFSGIAGSDNRSGGGVPELDGLAFRAEYDPLNPAESAVVNDSLTRLGFCLILEDQTFNTSVRGVSGYCNAPLRSHYAGAGARGSRRDKADHASASANGRMHAGFRQPSTRGVLYRPRVPYNYYLFLRQGSAGDWRLRETTTISLENKSPIISVGVDRSYFANRRTALAFDAGVLQNICIYKSSEAEELAQIPLAIATNLADLPGNIVQLRVDNTNNFKRLVDVQERLLRAQAEHARVLREEADATAFKEAADKPTAAAVPKVYAPVDEDGKPVALAKKTEASYGGFPTDWADVCGLGPKFLPPNVDALAPSSTVFSKVAPTAPKD